MSSSWSGRCLRSGVAAGLLALGGLLMPAVSAGTAGAAPVTTGYWEVAADGGIFAFGGAPYLGSMGGMHVNAPIVGMAATGDGKGYWLVASDGGVFAFGDATFYGSAATMTLHRPIVGITATPDNRGYWLVGADGGVFSYGDAGYFGSWPADNPQSEGNGPPWPFIGLVSSHDGKGYALANGNGLSGHGFGDYGTCAVGIEGSLSAEYTGVSAALGSSGTGCWVASSDGGVTAGGTAGLYGSMSGRPLHAPVVTMALTSDDAGYWLAAADGGVFAFGDASFQGSMGGTPLNMPVVGMAAASD